jgi:peptide-methionine (S)-S-oxide reductase
MSATTNTDNTETAIFAAGCFWGVEAAFRQRLGKGVIETEVGYIGGHAANPTYKLVCSGTTGHAEAVRVVFDPQQISYEQLLEVFWNCHDPTQVNRQGPDVGTQYRSGIFYANDAQRETAERSRTQLAEAGRFSRPIATEITAATTFWPAEDYHQRYLEKNGIAACPSSHGSSA